MKQIFLIVLVVALLCFAPQAAKANCQQDLTNYFSQYNPSPTTYVLSQSGTSITLMVNYYTETSGYSTLQYDPNCQMPYPQIYHRAWANIIVGSGTSGRQEGTPNCATCQLDESASYGQSMNSGDPPAYAYEEGGADCNIAGTFYSLMPILQLEVAYTRAKGLGTFGNCSGVTYINCDYDTYSYCYPSTAPPDMTIAKVRALFPQTPPLIWEAFGLGFRWYPYQTNWIFTNATIYAYKSGLDYPAFCTKNP